MDNGFLTSVETVGAKATYERPRYSYVEHRRAGIVDDHDVRKKWTKGFWCV